MYLFHVQFSRPPGDLIGPQPHHFPHLHVHVYAVISCSLFALPNFQIQLPPLTVAEFRVSALCRYGIEGESFPWRQLWMVTLTLNSVIRWDDWVPQDRLRKFTEDNRELAATLRRDAEAALRQRSNKGSSKKRGGSDRSSARGSEERQSSVPARGTKRNRDNEIEKVRLLLVMQVSTQVSSLHRNSEFLLSCHMSFLFIANNASFAEF